MRVCCPSLRVIAGLRGHSNAGRARSRRGPQDAVNRESAHGGAPEPSKRGHKHGGRDRYLRGPRKAVNRESAPGGAPEPSKRGHERGGRARYPRIPRNAVGPRGSTRTRRRSRREPAAACSNSTSWTGERACRGWRKAGSSGSQRCASGEGVRLQTARPRVYAPRQQVTSRGRLLQRAFKGKCDRGAAGAGRTGAVPRDRPTVARDPRLPVAACMAP